MLRIGVFIVILLLICTRDVAAASTLETYVQREREAFNWRLERTVARDDGIHIAYLLVDSGVWQGTVWTHRLRVVIPPETAQQGALLYVTGSGSGDSDLQLMARVALKAKRPVAILHDVPNQPLFDGLREDALIAHSFIQYLESGDRDWPALFPMTRSVVAAMDTLQQWAAGEKQSGLDLDTFIISGASKRGWTTWLTAAVDPRVVGIIPAVYDNLNLPAQMQHQLDTWGQYSEQISDYTELDIPQMLETPEGLELANLVDPYAYRHAITVPTLILVGTNDPYWPLDAVNLYFAELIGPAHVHYVPNAGHGLNENQLLVETIAAFARTQLEPETVGSWPELRWELDTAEESVQLKLETTTPGIIRFWQATSTTRDFRQSHWQTVSLQQNVQTAAYQYARHAGFYQAILAEVLFQDNGLQYAVAAPVQIIPPR